MTLGRPRVHLRATTSTNERARELAVAGAPHGTLVTTGLQTAGRGRHGRTWTAPEGRALLMSLVLRSFDALAPLRAGLAVADLAGAGARVKWPNDVLVDGRKVAGVLVEARPQEDWAVLGIGINVALSVDELPVATAGTLDRAPGELEAALGEVLAFLERWLDEPVAGVLAALRARDALLDRPVAWAGGDGVAAGIDDAGGLLVRRGDGVVVTLDAGEVHLR